MKKNVNIGVILIASLFLMASCDLFKNAYRNSSKTQRGTAIGTTGGAAAGAAIGSQIGKGNTAWGALIGAVVGGLTGTYIGNRMDRQAEKIEEEIPGAEVKRVGEGINVTFDENSGVFFATNKSNINASSAKVLGKLCKVLEEFPKTNILIEGHTDSRGSDNYNYNLSQRRANSVSSFLQNRGINPARLITKWYGETQPKYDNGSKTGRAKNRRVEFAIIANDALKREAKQKTRQ